MPYVVYCTRIRGALSVDGRTSASPAPTPRSVDPATFASAVMFDECSDELCAESSEPSTDCAQFADSWIFTIAMLLAASSAQGGGTNSGFASDGPMYVHTKPPDSIV